MLKLTQTATFLHLHWCGAGLPPPARAQSSGKSGQIAAQGTLLLASAARTAPVHHGTWDGTMQCLDDPLYLRRILDNLQYISIHSFSFERTVYNII